MFYFLADPNLSVVLASQMGDAVRTACSHSSEELQELMRTKKVSPTQVSYYVQMVSQFLFIYLETNNS